MQIRRSDVAWLLVTALGLSACGGTEKGGGSNAFFPLEETLYLPTPEESKDVSGALTAAQTRTSTKCLTGYPAYQKLKNAFQKFRDGVEDKIDLLRAMAKMADATLKKDKEWEKTISIGGRSLTASIALNPDGSYTYAINFSGPMVSFKLLDGTVDANKLSGTWTTYNQSGMAIVAVTWSKAGDTVTVTRTNQKAGVTATYVRTGTTVTVTLTGPEHSGKMSWDKNTKAGYAEWDGQQKACWNEMICMVPCS